MKIVHSVFLDKKKSLESYKVLYLLPFDLNHTFHKAMYFSRALYRVNCVPESALPQVSGG